jgi:hypothetical protein
MSSIGVFSFIVVFYTGYLFELFGAGDYWFYPDSGATANAQSIIDSSKSGGDTHTVFYSSDRQTHFVIVCFSTYT